MFRYTPAEMVWPGATGKRQMHARRYSRRASCSACSPPRWRRPPPAPAPLPAPSTTCRRRRARRREVARLDRRAEILTEKYNVARAALDAVNIRLQAARRDLDRARAEFDAAQAIRGKRLAAMYKSDSYSVLDVIFSLNDIGEADTQFGYFRAIDKADQETVTASPRWSCRWSRCTADGQGQGGRPGPRDGAARAAGAIEDQLATREKLLADLDARVKRLIAEQARLDAEALSAWPGRGRRSRRPSPGRRRRSPSSRRR